MSSLSTPHWHREDAAFADLEAKRRPNGPMCPHCGSMATHDDLAKIRHGRAKWAEKPCRKLFMV